MNRFLLSWIIVCFQANTTVTQCYFRINTEKTHIPAEWECGASRVLQHLFWNRVWILDCSVWPNLNSDISWAHPTTDLYWKGFSILSYLASEDVLSLYWKADYHGDMLKGMMKHCDLKALYRFVLVHFSDNIRPAFFSGLLHCVFPLITDNNRRRPSLSPTSTNLIIREIQFK